MYFINTESEDSMKIENLGRRILFFIIGTTFNALGITLITKAYLGTSPISSLPFVLSLGLPPSFGTLTFVFNMIFFFGQIFLLKKAFPKIQVLQIPVTLFFSLLIDMFMFFFQNVKPANYFYSLLLLVLGCLVMGLGITLAVGANLVMTPGNAFVQALSDYTKKPFGNIKIGFDCTLTALAVLSSFILFGTFRGVREGTIISSILVGSFINVSQRLLGDFLTGKKKIDADVNVEVEEECLEEM